MPYGHDHAGRLEDVVMGYIGVVRNTLPPNR